MKGSILIVDDDPETRTILTKVLRGAGYSCEETSDGFSAVEMAQKNQYNIVFIDLLMPGPPGNEIIAQIKSAAPETAVGVVSIITGEGAIKELFHSGVSVYIPKPFNAEEIISTAESLIRQKESTH